MKEWFKYHKYTALILIGLLFVLMTHLFIAYSLANAEPKEWSFKLIYTVETYPDFNKGIAIYMRTGEIDLNDSTSGYELIKEFPEVQPAISEELFNKLATDHAFPYTWEQVQNWRAVQVTTPPMEFSDFVNTLIATKGIDVQGSYSDLSAGEVINLPKFPPPIFISIID